MNRCEFVDAGTVELYFYGELDAPAAERLEGHLLRCGTCRQHVDDLRSIRAALAVRPRVDAPPSGDWSAFTSRLDAAMATTASAPPRGRTVAPWFAIAATLTLIASGVFFTGRLRHDGPPPTEAFASPAAPPAAAPPLAMPRRLEPDGRGSVTVADRSLVEHSEEHFERSKVVVLGLATLDPEHARAADWQHERELAGSLLPDTRLYRLTAEERGMTGLARVLGDLETVLLETSMTERPDPDALQRVQRLIARRDLVVKMNVVGSGI